MRIEENYSLEKHNTFHLPVKTRWFMEYMNEEELERIFRDEYFQECLSLHIGSGSNLLFINDFNGVILHWQIKGISVAEETDDSVLLRIGAAEKWDDVVAYAVSEGWGGIENLSGIPGEAGAAAVQNIGAYGTEIKDVVDAVDAYIQLSFEKRVFTNENITDLKRIKKLKDMGMTLKDIKNFNQLYSKGKLSFEQKIMILDQQHTVIIEQIEELQHTLEIIETERLKYSNIINKNHTAIICS